MPIIRFFCRLVPACCTQQIWAMSDEMVEESVWNWSILCDLLPSFSHFAVCLKNDSGKTGILNTEPDQRWTDKPLLCHYREINYLLIGLLVFGMWHYVKRTRTLNSWRRQKRSMFLWNMWDQSPHKEVWHPGGLKSLITIIWKTQKSKIPYLLDTTWQWQSLHYKTFYNTEDLTFHSNRIIP